MPWIKSAAYRIMWTYGKYKSSGEHRDGAFYCMNPLGFNVSINFVTLHLSLKPASVKYNFLFTEKSIAEGNSK